MLSSSTPGNKCPCVPGVRSHTQHAMHSRPMAYPDRWDCVCGIVRVGVCCKAGDES